MKKTGEVAKPLENSTQDAIDTLLNVVPEDKKDVATRALSIICQEYYEGPVPHPKIIREYEAVLPGSADRILKMAEKQQEHRIVLETKNIDNHLKINRRGQIFGFVVFILGIILSLIFALLDMKTFAGIFATGTVVVIITLFINGKIQIKKDLHEKSVKKQ